MWILLFVVIILLCFWIIAIQGLSHGEAVGLALVEFVIFGFVLWGLTTISTANFNWQYVPTHGQTEKVLAVRLNDQGEYEYADKPQGVGASMVCGGGTCYYPYEWYMTDGPAELVREDRQDVVMEKQEMKVNGDETDIINFLLPPPNGPRYIFRVPENYQLGDGLEPFTQP